MLATGFYLKNPAAILPIFALAASFRRTAGLQAVYHIPSHFAGT